MNPELEKTNAYWKIPNFESYLIKIFKQNATIVDTPNITIDTKRRERIFGIISLSNWICIAVIIIAGRKIFMTKEESLEVEDSSKSPFFLTKYPTKIIMNKTATCVKIFLKLKYLTSQNFLKKYFRYNNFIINLLK